MAEPLREFTRFIWWMQNGAKQPPTQDQLARWQAVSPPVHAASVYTRNRHLLLLLSPKADTHLPSHKA